MMVKTKDVMVLADSGQLSERFQLTAITSRKTITLTSDFHHQIAHFLASWKPKFIFVA